MKLISSGIVLFAGQCWGLNNGKSTITISLLV
jgi:hypothetical protein